MDNETINEMEQTTKELDLSAEEIQGYIACSNRMQYCLTDCPWPFDGAYLSGID
nr:pseudouridine synthase [uncultured Blautia sp.]